MIQIYVEGRALELPSDISFEYTVENRLFSNADGYSFDIEILLRDSAVNSDIFGMIFDPQTDIETVKFQAQLITPQLSLTGIVAIAGVSESMLSIQFLEGRSVQNFEKDLQEIYVNELKLDPFAKPEPYEAPINHWGSYDEGTEAVAIPWVNGNSGIVQNNVVKSNESWRDWSWDTENRGLSYMPYLCVLIRKICSCIGYGCDIDALESSRFRHLLVCNTLPAALGVSEYSAALPHWTVQEFFENLEVILQGEFDIDNANKVVSFEFTRQILDDIEPVYLEDVVDEFSAEIDSMNDDETDLELMRNISFKDNGSRFWKLQSCDWFVELRRKNPDSIWGWVAPGTGLTVGDDGHRYVEGERIYKSLVEFDSMKEFLDLVKHYEYFGWHRNDIVQHNLYYVKEYDCYFILHSTEFVQMPDGRWCYHFEAFLVNQFGSCIIDKDNADDGIEISTVPVPVDVAEFKCAFLYFSNNADNDVAGDEILAGDSIEDFDESFRENAQTLQPLVYQTILNGESSKVSEYFDRLYLGFWEGFQPYHTDIGIRPVTTNIVICDYFKYMEFPDFSLRLNHGFSRGFDGYKSIEPKHLYKFSFLSDKLPSARATFFIKGKRYVCAKLTASFSAEGMSNLVKGEFYRY